PHHVHEPRLGEDAGEEAEAGPAGVLVQELGAALGPRARLEEGAEPAPYPGRDVGGREVAGGVHVHGRNTRADEAVGFRRREAPSRAGACTGKRGTEQHPVPPGGGVQEREAVIHVGDEAEGGMARQHLVHEGGAAAARADDEDRAHCAVPLRRLPGRRRGGGPPHGTPPQRLYRCRGGRLAHGACTNAGLGFWLSQASTPSAAMNRKMEGAAYGRSLRYRNDMKKSGMAACSPRATARFHGTASRARAMRPASRNAPARTPSTATTPRTPVSQRNLVSPRRSIFSG